MSASEVPTSEVAVTAYESQGGNLTVFPCFGVDPLGNNATQQAMREQQFHNVTDLRNAFGDLANAVGHSFENAILRYANITISYWPWWCKRGNNIRKVDKQLYFTRFNSLSEIQIPNWSEFLIL